jgi:hypothetical protein
MSVGTDCIDLSCFDEIIGLSETTCECLPDNNYHLSNSCLFLDKAEGMNLKQIDSLAGCETESDLWLMMNDARSRAIKRFVSDAQAKMSQRYQLARTIFTGYIGKSQAKTIKAVGKTYAGVRIHPAQVVGGYITIKAINTYFEKTDTISLDIYNCLNEKLYTVSLDTEAGKMHRNLLATPITLPLWSGEVDNLDYVFVYTYDANNRPYNTELSCCGKNYHFDCNRPYYSRHSNKLDGWANYMMCGEWSGDTLDFIDLECTCSDCTNGLQLEATTYCDTTKQFCFDEQDMNNPQYLTVAFAVLHAAAQYLCISLITSDKINRYTMTNIEQLEAVRQLHETKYQEALTWCIDNVDLHNTDCYLCKTPYSFKKTTL